MTVLADRLDAFADTIRQIEEKAAATLKAYPVTDELLERTRNDYRSYRYVLVRPDGGIYYNISGMVPRVYGYSQRPAALKHAKWYPACRVLDTKTGKVLEP